ncbi:MAG: NAD-dependent epimerase/dehydratase family protein [Magnetococcus sp. DMHC-6]
MAKFLITGGCGFIGSHLADALVARGDEVFILDDLSSGKRENPPKACSIIIGDVSEPEMVQAVMAGMDGCFHLAAVVSVPKSNEDWLGTHRVNQTGTIQVLNAARCQGKGHPVPVVYASSAAVYGDNPDQPLVESSRTSPLTAYGADKLGSELHARVAWEIHRIPTLGLRFFNVYGPRQDPSSPYSGVISIFVDRILKGEFLRIYGRGDQIRDFVYVGDVVRYLMASMERCHRDPARVFNVCTGRTTTILGLAHTLFSVIGREVPLQHEAPRSGDIHTSMGNPQMLNNAFGFTADTTLQEGLARMVF